MDVIKGKVPGSNWVNRPKVQPDDRTLGLLAPPLASFITYVHYPQASEEFQVLQNDPMVRMKAAKDRCVRL